MSAPWIVVMPAVADAPVYGNEEAARAFAEDCCRNTAGNVDSVPMPLAVALEAPAMLHALQTLMAWIDSKPLPGTRAELDAWGDELHHREERARAILARIAGAA